MRHIEISVSFDMRAPAWATPSAGLFEAAIEMARFADAIGVDRIGLMEHHGSEDGYLPQPFVLAAGMAAVTQSVRFLLSAVILPLHDPVIVAEQIAVLDLVSRGRLNVVLGAGYVPSEFAMFGKSLADRARLMDDGIAAILRALDGERFDLGGRPVFVRPAPIQTANEILLVGGGVPASARRAARFDLGFVPLKPELIDIYLAECRKLGRLPRRYNRPTPGMPIAVHLCEDADAGWARIEKHAVHVITEYAKWAEQEGEGSNSPFKGLTDPAALRSSGLFAAWTPDELLDRVSTLPRGTAIDFQPLLGGLSPDDGWRSLELLEESIGRLRQAAGEIQ